MAENLLNKQRWSAAAFLPKKTAALPLFAGDEKKQRRYRYREGSGASSAAVPITDYVINQNDKSKHVRDPAVLQDTNEENFICCLLI